MPPHDRSGGEPLRVPFLDLTKQHYLIREDLRTVANRVALSGQYVLGSEVTAFENAWAEYCNARYAVSVGSGLDALHLALRAVGVLPGDEVLVPSNTFIATWLAVEMCGAVPVPVEPDSETLNISPDEILRSISSRTKALVVVHLYGQPVELDQIMQICEENGVTLVEDAAQAHGARFNGKRIGAHSSAVAWSFYPGKNLGALGDAGAVTTNDSAVAEKVQLMRNYGSKQKYVHEVFGVNSRMDEIQAGFLMVKLRYLDLWNMRRQEIAGRYSSELSALISNDPVPQKPRLIALPHVIPRAESAWHLYVIRVTARDDFIALLEREGIEVGIHYPIPPAEQGKLWGQTHLTSASFTSTSCKELVSLPIGPHLEDDQVRKVIEVISSIVSQ